MTNNFSETDNAFIIPDEDIERFQQLGFSGSTVALYEDQLDYDDELHEEENDIEYLLDGDIMISRDQLKEMTIEKDEKTIGQNDVTGKQYRTRFLVKWRRGRGRNGHLIKTRTIKVVANFIGDENMRQGIINAIENYNELGLMLNFELKFTNITGKPLRSLYLNSDIFIQVKRGLNGGRAGFPSKFGNPYKDIYIGDAITNATEDKYEHIISHEIGHCIGLRHTDWFDRSLSCGGTENNSERNNLLRQAILIPGTADFSSSNSNSIMRACFKNNETGEFTEEDIIALRAMYPIR